MTLKSYLVEAELDLKINKRMPWSKFMQLLQKLALDTWNKCFNNVFKEQREEELLKVARSFKLACAEDNPKLARAITQSDIVACQEMFILQRINLFINESPYFNDEDEPLLNTSDEEDEIHVDNMMNMMVPRSNSDSHIHDKSISLDNKQQ